MDIVQPRPNRRAQQSAETRALIISAARRLFIEQGFVPTTIERLARECGVAVQTIYNSVGTKTEILSRIIDQAAAGERAPASPLEFLDKELRATDSPDAIARVLSQWFAEVNARMAPIYQVLTDAAAVDPAAAALRDARDAQRFERYLMVPALLKDGGGRANSPTADDDLAALIWNTGHPRTYRFLLVDRGWTEARYTHWCHTVLAGAFT